MFAKYVLDDKEKIRIQSHMKRTHEYLANPEVGHMKEHAIDSRDHIRTDPHQSELPPINWRGREWHNRIRIGKRNKAVRR